jgi:hypothetical protein
MKLVKNTAIEVDAPRRAWTAPSARRLATSAAESGDTISFDATELPS